MSRSRPRTSSASIRRYCSRRRARSSRSLRSSAGSPSPAARASAIAATSRFARSRARRTRCRKYRSPPLVVSIPANRSTASTARSRRASMSASRSARSSSALRSVSAGPRPTPGGAPVTPATPAPPWVSSESAPRRSAKHSSKSDEKTARSSGRLISVACIAMRKASRSRRSTCRIADAASSTSPSETSTPPSLSAANRRSSIARMPSPASVTSCRASR